MKIWEVGISNCESCHTFALCTTKEIALREMFRKRDELIAQWKEAKIRNEESTKKFLEEQASKGVFYGFKGDERNMWQEMIDELSHDDYEKWDNYPHEVPWIRQTDVMDN